MKYKLIPVILTAAFTSVMTLFAVSHFSHQAPYFTDNSMHNLQAERFYTPRMVSGMMASADGPIKTFPLRGVKDSPPYLHDGRLLTLEDTVEYFNMILETKLSAQEKVDLVAFLRTL